MWRNPTDLFPGVESSALPAPPPLGSVALGAGAPAAVTARPVAAAPPCEAESLCAIPRCEIPGCEIPAARVYTGYCLGHHDAYLTRAFELTQDIGRGELL